MDSHRLSLLARRQNGLFTRAQARACGFTAAHLRHRLTTGAWIQVLGRALAPAELAIDLAVRDRAAQLAVPGSVLAGPSAARRWGIEVPTGPAHLIVAGRCRPVPGVRLERVALPARDLTVVNGAPATARPRAIFDCLRVLPVDNAARLLDQALQRDWLRRDDLARFLHEWAGRPGIGQALRLTRSIGDGSRSALERRATNLLRRAGVRGWIANAEIHDDRGPIGIGDIVFRTARVVVELDGLAYHVTPDAFQRDRTRQNRLVAAGWTVLRFTWLDLTQRPDYVIRTVLAALSRA